MKRSVATCMLTSTCDLRGLCRTVSRGHEGGRAGATVGRRFNGNAHQVRLRDGLRLRLSYSDDRSIDGASEPVRWSDGAGQPGHRPRRRRTKCSSTISVTTAAASWHRAGAVTLSVEGWLDDDGDLDPVVPQAIQHPIEDLPLEALPFLVASRYCESDLLSNEAWRLFGDVTPGWARAQAVCDWVHGHISFGYGYSNVDRTAADALAVGRGVCRDYAHLFVAFCRGLNMPTRYCTGYLSFIGEPEPHAPGDFAAWTEVYLGGAWHVFDPRNNAPRRGRILVARGTRCGGRPADPYVRNERPDEVQGVGRGGHGRRPSPQIGGCQ